jgi:hypothetical protein
VGLQLQGAGPYILHSLTGQQIKAQLRKSGDEPLFLCGLTPSIKPGL